MAPKDNKQSYFSYSIPDIYRGISPDVIKDNDYLEKIQRNCVEQSNPFVCFITLLLAENPEITWRHNTGQHFGIVDLQYEDFFDLIHPAWLFVYMNYGRAMYEVAYRNPELVMENSAAAGSLVPLRHRSGTYYWYHQISIRVANDGTKLAAHLNYYHQSTTYTGQLPTMPTFTTAGENNPVLTAELNKLALTFLPDFLGEFLPESQVNFMLQHRKIIFAAGGQKPTQRQLLEQLPDIKSGENLNKIKHRIGKNLKTHFKHPSLDSAYGLSVMLNRYFPLI